MFILATVWSWFADPYLDFTYICITLSGLLLSWPTVSCAFSWKNNNLCILFNFLCRGTQKNATNVNKNVLNLVYCLIIIEYLILIQLKTQLIKQTKKQWSFVVSKIKIDVIFMLLIYVSAYIYIKLLLSHSCNVATYYENVLHIQFW